MYTIPSLVVENYRKDDLIDIIRLLVENGMEVLSSENDIGNNAHL